VELQNSKTGYGRKIPVVREIHHTIRNQCGCELEGIRRFNQKTGSKLCGSTTVDENPLNPPLRKGEARRRIKNIPPLYEGVRGVYLKLTAER